jgi:hypothetical protein
MWWTAIIRNGETYEALEFLDGPEPAEAFQHVRKVTEPDGTTIVAVLKGQMSSSCWGTQDGDLVCPAAPTKTNRNRTRPPC